MPIYRFEKKEIVETDCLILEDIQSKSKSNEGYRMMEIPDSSTTKDGKITFGKDIKCRKSNSTSFIYL